MVVKWLFHWWGWRLWWNVSEWEWRVRGQREEGQQARRAEVRLLRQTGKCGKYRPSYNCLTLFEYEGCVWKLKSDVCVFQRKSWKRRFFTLDDSAVSYYKSETVSTQTFRVSCHMFMFLLVFLCPCLNCVFVCSGEGATPSDSAEGHPEGPWVSRQVRVSQILPRYHFLSPSGLLSSTDVNKFKYTNESR